MKRAFKIMMIMSLALAVLAILGSLGFWHEASSTPGLSVSVNGRDLDLDFDGLGGFGGFGSLSGLGWILGLGISVVVACVILPLVLLFSIGLPVLIIGMVVAGVVAGVMSVGALLFSPLIVIGLLLWLLLRTRKPAHRSDSIGP